MNQKELLIISITVFLTIIAWIVADIYHITITQKIKAVDSPIISTNMIIIDTSILDSLQTKIDE